MEVPANKDTRDPGRRIQFDKETEPGVYLLLRNSGLRTLQGYYDKNHIQIVEAAFLTIDIPIIDRLLEVMVWKDDERYEVTFDDLDKVPADVVVDKLRDAWCLAINGRTYLEQVNFIRAEAKKLNEDPSRTNPAAGSAPSEDQPTKQG